MKSIKYLQRLQWEKFEKRGVSIWAWREDLNHPQLSGNKWYKVNFHLQKAIDAGCDHVVSMGGPWSNHLHALAAATYDADINAIGFVRGDALRFMSPMLEDALSWGLDLKFVDFPTYRRIREMGAYHPLVKNLGSNHYFIPEGGSNHETSQAFKPLVTAIEQAVDADYWACATGTGGTLAGLIHHVQQKTCIIGVQAVAEGDATAQRIASWLPKGDSVASWQLWRQYHRGGFGKIDTQLRVFIEAAQRHLQLPLDPIYNSKTLLALSEALDDGFFSAGDRVVMIHTGGLQGCRGLASLSSDELTKPEVAQWMRTWDF